MKRFGFCLTILLALSFFAVSPAEAKKTKAKGQKISQTKTPRKKKRTYVPLPAKESSSREPAALVDQTQHRHGTVQAVEIPSK
ncbi:MAG: hypothetical protein KF865_11885 [Bdellovibrionaceae bacterium]|nr:hypothetical protein [Pseudobdellovibrionaceae bacterium]